MKPVKNLPKSETQPSKYNFGVVHLLWGIWYSPVVSPVLGKRDYYIPMTFQFLLVYVAENMIHL